MPEFVGLEHSVHAPRHARRWMSEQCRRWGCDELADPASLMLSELVTNVFLHAGTECVVEAHYADPVLSVTVTDGLDGELVPQSVPPTAEDGRGLGIVAALAADWGADNNGSGKSVWFSLDGARPAVAAGERD